MRADADVVALSSSGHLETFTAASFPDWTTAASARTTTTTTTTAAATPATVKDIDQSLHPCGNTILAGTI
jgi:hypothetical protein